MIVAAADGSALSNPGPAGWAWYISDDVWASGGWPHGTNNMGELMAVLDLLQSTSGTGEPLTIICDSQYVINSLTKWMPGWKRRGWKKGDGKPVLNVELMKQLDAALEGREVQFEWVKGHAGHRMNEAADELARAAALAFQAGSDFNPGPGFPDSSPSARAQNFDVGARDEEPDLFSQGEPEEPAPAAPGGAAPRTRAALVALTREVLGGDVGRYLHHDFAGHGDWEPSNRDFEVLAVDEYADGVVGVRWQQEAALRFWLWQKLPAGWKLRFASTT